MLRMTAGVLYGDLRDNSEHVTLRGLAPSSHTAVRWSNRCGTGEQAGVSTFRHIGSGRYIGVVATLPAA
jgi:hypothetical protein